MAAQAPKDPVTEELVDDFMHGVTLVLGLTFSGVHAVRQDSKPHVWKRLHGVLEFCRYRCNSRDFGKNLQADGMTQNEA